MPLYALGDLVPAIDPSAFVHPDAVIIGAVQLGPFASVWPSAVLRGDGNEIVVGARSSIQDGSVIHTAAEQPTIVGQGCTVGHLVHMEACTIADNSLVGSGAVILPGAMVGHGVVIGANALVRSGVRVPDGALAVGVPARIIEDGADPGLIAYSERTYLEKVDRYRTELRRLD